MAKERITRRFKVYTTRIGIRDWAVAVPSQKEALKAWDVRENLFASGAAHLVDDPAVMAAALKTPGIPVAAPGRPSVPPEAKSNVIRLKDRRLAPKKAPAPEGKRVGAERRPPSPDRSKLAAAEDELRAFDVEVKARRKELARRKADLERESESLEIDAQTKRRRLERRLGRERGAYERAKSS